MENGVYWYVIYTKSRQEKVVADRLSTYGFEIYLPLIKILSQWSDRKKFVEKPLFNSYVFIKDMNDIDKIKNINGVVRFLRYNSKPAVVYQREIDTLKSIIKHGYDVSEFVDTQELILGSKVMVMGGPLKGGIGELYSNSESDWFIISFENLGNSIMVKIPGKLLRPVL